MPPINFGLLRQQNLFQPEGPPYQPFEGPPYEPQMEPPLSPNLYQAMTPEDAVAMRFRELYRPETEASDRYNQLAQQMPKRNKPGFLRKLGASFVAVGPGIQAAEHSLDPKFYHGMEDWKAQMEPAERAMQQERYENVNKRYLAAQTSRQDIAERRQTEAERHNRATEENTAKRNEIYRMKQMNPNLKFDFSGPTVLVGDPGTGKVTDTKIPTGSLSEVDKINLQGEWAVERTAQAGQNAIDLENVRQPNRQTNIETRGWSMGVDPETGKGILYNQITGETKPLKTPVIPTSVATAQAGAGEGGEQPSQTKVRKFNRAQQAYSNPKWRKYITLNPNGTNTYRIDKPPAPGFLRGVTSGNPTNEDWNNYKEAYKFIEGEYPTFNEPKLPGPTSSTTPPNSQRMVKMQRNVKTGETRQVESLDGGKTWHPVK